MVVHVTVPSSLGNGQCDCVRQNNNEWYWNGTKCVAAAAYGQPCIANTNYTCEIKTEKTMCNSSGICSCGTNGGLDSGQCISCNNDWKYINKKCYRIGTSSGQADSGGSVSGLSSACPNGNSVNLAQLTSTEIIDYFKSLTTSGRYWVDLQKYCTSPTKYQSCNNCGSSSNCNWQISTSSDFCGSISWDSCVYYNVASDCYQDAQCSDTRPYFCQYDAQ